MRAASLQRSDPIVPGQRLAPPPEEAGAISCATRARNHKPSPSNSAKAGQYITATIESADYRPFSEHARGRILVVKRRKQVSNSLVRLAEFDPTALACRWQRQIRIDDRADAVLETQANQPAQARIMASNSPPSSFARRVLTLPQSRSRDQGGVGSTDSCDANLMCRGVRPEQAISQCSQPAHRGGPHAHRSHPTSGHRA